MPKENAAHCVSKVQLYAVTRMVSTYQSTRLLMNLSGLISNQHLTLMYMYMSL